MPPLREELENILVGFTPQALRFAFHCLPAFFNRITDGIENDNPLAVKKRGVTLRDFPGRFRAV